MFAALSFPVNPITITGNDDKINYKNKIILKDELIVHEMAALVDLLNDCMRREIKSMVYDKLKVKKLAACHTTHLKPYYR